MIYNVFVLLLSPALAAAALYPTSPTSSTVFHTGFAHTCLIRWVDDTHAPPTNQLGYLNIDLMLENTIIATLAKNVPSTYRELELHVPPGIGPDSSDYAIVFIPSMPFSSIYSARFTISNYTSGPPPADAINSTATSSIFSPIISTEIASVTHLSTSSTLKPTSTFMPGKEKIGTTASGGHRVRIESSARFRALYVLWPVLVGAALAS